MPTRPLDQKTSVIIPVELAGKWIAWNSDHSKILAHDDDLQKLWQAVKEQDIKNPVFEKAPRVDVLFVGMR